MQLLSHLARLLSPNEQSCARALDSSRHFARPVAWTAALETGNDYIDAQHSLLLLLLEGLERVTVSGEHQEPFVRRLREIRKYLDFHFTSEENLLAELDKPNLKAHAKEHSDMLAELSALTSRVHDARMTAKAVRDYLIAWLNDHVSREAHEWRELFRYRGAARRPEEAR